MITISIHSDNPDENQIFEGDLLVFSMVSKTPEVPGGLKVDAEVIGKGGHEKFIAAMSGASTAVAEAIKDCQPCRMRAARKCQEILVPEAAEFAKKMMADVFGGNRNED